MVSVLSGRTYPYFFCTPQNSPHDRIRRATFDSGESLWGPLQALSIPWTRSLADVQLIHAFNGIPVSRRPYVLSFEAELPRSLHGFGHDVVRRMLFSRLTSRRCRGLFPISGYAMRRFRSFAAACPGVEEAVGRCRVVHPAVALRRREAREASRDRLVLTFVGGEWARKGGPTAIRLLRRLRRAGIDAVLNVVSALDHGLHIYTDTDAAFYAADRAGLGEAGVVFHGRLPNDRVLDLVGESDFCLLPSLDDTFGYSVLESMSLGVPVVASDICALPEMIDHGVDGLLIELPKTDIGRWADLPRRGADRTAPAYREILDHTIETMAAAAFDLLVGLRDDPDAYRRLSAGAIAKVAARFEAADRALDWHRIYQAALA